jgi:cytochrome b subunit of formate dehydrogenase
LTPRKGGIAMKIKRILSGIEAIKKSIDEMDKDPKDRLYRILKKMRLIAEILNVAASIISGIMIFSAYLIIYSASHPHEENAAIDPILSILLLFVIIYIVFHIIRFAVLLFLMALIFSPLINRKTEELRKAILPYREPYLVFLRHFSTDNTLTRSERVLEMLQATHKEE